MRVPLFLAMVFITGAACANNNDTPSARREQPSRPAPTATTGGRPERTTTTLGSYVPVFAGLGGDGPTPDPKPLPALTAGPPGAEIRIGGGWQAVMTVPGDHVTCKTQQPDPENRRVTPNTRWVTSSHPKTIGDGAYSLPRSGGLEVELQRPYHYSTYDGLDHDYRYSVHLGFRDKTGRAWEAVSLSPAIDSTVKTPLVSVAADGAAVAFSDVLVPDGSGYDDADQIDNTWVTGIIRCPTPPEPPLEDYPETPQATFGD